MEKSARLGLRNPAAAEGARERTAAVQGRSAMKFLPLQIRSALGRRVLSQYLCIAMLPVAALAGLFYVQANAVLQEARDQELAQAARAYADALKDRLIVAERAVSAAAAAGVANRIRDDLMDGASRQFEAVALISAAGLQVDAPGKVAELPELDFETRQQLDAGRALMRFTEERIPRIVLLHGLPAGGRERLYLAAVIDARYLAGDPRRNPVQTEFCVMSATRVVAGCRRSVAGSPRAQLQQHAEASSDQAVLSRDGEDDYRSTALRLSLEPAHAGSSWTVIATQSESYALAPTRSTGGAFLWIAAITAVLAVALGARQVQRFVAPLEQLLAGTRRIARQDFSAQIPVQGRDEIAQLTRAHNEMARDLGMNFAALNVLLHIDQAILTRPDVGEGVRSALRYVRYITAIDSVILCLFEGHDNGVMRLYSLRPKGRKRHDRTVFQLPDEVRQRGLASLPCGRWIDDPPLPMDLQMRLRNEDGIKHFWIQPVARDQRIWGIIVLGHSAQPALSDRQLALLAGVAGRLEVAFSTVERDRKLHALAHVDALTGLPNRPALVTLLTQHLAHAHRHRCYVGVLFLDLDRFKQVNDTLGHAVGDLLLQHAAQRIRRNLREDDTVARLGGDEFTIVLGNLVSGRDAGTVARQLITALLRPFEIDGHMIDVGASMGIAIYPVDGTEGNDLLKKADTAMYRAKEEGRNRFAFYDENMNVEARQRATLDRELRHAIKHDQFVLHYQPQIDLQTGRVCSVEALVRWRHPERGLLYPDAFIAFAEGSGLIPQIGIWVMREACLQHQRWRAAGVPIPGIAVNVSNDQLRRPNFVRSVLFLLNLAQMPQGSFEIEVTESMFLEGGKTALDALHTLVEAGVKVAIDDFGTGYSSFGYLKTLPASVLKLDKSFLVDVAAGNDAATIVEALIDMAHTLRKEVVAEGVEREDQLEFLRGLGCERVQGYLYSRPLPADEIARYALARSEQYPLPAASVSQAAAPAGFRSAVAPSAGVQRAANRPDETAAEGSGARDGDVEEVVIDDGLTTEDIVEPAAVRNRSWRVLWPGPAGIAAKETMTNDAVHRDSAVLE